jgi:hypothetical protein
LGLSGLERRLEGAVRHPFAFPVSLQADRRIGVVAEDVFGVVLVPARLDRRLRRAEGGEGRGGLALAAQRPGDEAVGAVAPLGQ